MYQTSHDNDQMTSLSFVIAPLDVADDHVPLVNKETALDNIRYTKSAIVHLIRQTFTKGPLQSGSVNWILQKLQGTTQ